ncbi:MAG TPA: FecR family protein [Terriglobales bacterium]|nr:FecR family protein [Terriglobales bacterium]
MIARRLAAGFLCFALSPLPALCSPPPAEQNAGEISALMPAATRNAKLAKLKEELLWKDLLKTEQSGRLRARLLDGSILSMGSNSEMRVLQHQAQSQQTSLEMGAGRLRSRVIKLTQPGSKFELKTPHAVIGVIGTDFYTQVTADRTLVICYAGTVLVTPIGAVVAAQPDSSTAQPQPPTAGLTLLTGQMVDVGPGGSGVVQATPAALQQASIQDTEVPDAPVAKAGSHQLRNFLIGVAVTGAAIAALAATQGNGTRAGKPPGT